VLKIYTDGASAGNPGPGAYAAILQYHKHEKILVKGFRKTTNNRMELLAVIAGLTALKAERQVIEIYSDSRYVIDAIEKGWLQKWLRTGFKNKKNPDLWARFWELYQKHTIKFFWIKGHSGHVMNEQCDQLAVKCIKTGYLFIDEWYENHG
jgi:ribonuclease HI